jgi:hypothetical protein
MLNVSRWLRGLFQRDIESILSQTAQLCMRFRCQKLSLAGSKGDSFLNENRSLIAPLRESAIAHHLQLMQALQTGK